MEFSKRLQRWRQSYSKSMNSILLRAKELMGVYIVKLILPMKCQQREEENPSTISDHWKHVPELHKALGCIESVTHCRGEEPYN